MTRMLWVLAISCAGVLAMPGCDDDSRSTDDDGSDADSDGDTDTDADTDGDTDLRGAGGFRQS